MKILVTGGMGYIGSLLVENLLKRNNIVYIVDLMIYENKLNLNNKNLILIKEDIRYVDWDEILGNGVEVVYHLAGVSNDPGNGVDREEGFSINYDATINLYEKCIKNGVEKFVYPSSCSVYGKSKCISEENDIILDEQSPINPLTDYAIAKSKVEKYILNKKYSKEICTIIFRPATVYGLSYRQRFDLIVNSMVAEVINNGCISVSDKTNIRPTVYIKDLIRAYLLLLDADKEIVNGQVFNIAYDNYIIEDICKNVFKVVGHSVPINSNNISKSRSYRVNSDKIRKFLGFNPKYSMEDGVKELVDAFNKGAFKDYKINDNYFNKVCQPKFFGIK